MKSSLTNCLFIFILIAVTNPLVAQENYELINKAEELYSKGKFKEATNYYTKYFAKIDLIDCKKEWLNNLQNWGMAKIFSKDNSGYDQLITTEDCACRLGLNDLCANFKLNRAETHIVYFELNLAKRAALEALALEELTEKTKGEIFRQLAHSTRLLKNDSCIVFANKALEIGNNTKDTALLISTYTALSIYEKNNNYFHKAIKASQKSLQYLTGNHKLKRPQVFFNIAELFLELNDYNRAKLYIDSTLINLDQEKYISFTGRVNFSEGKIYEHENQLEKAKLKYESSLRRNKNQFLNMRAFRALARIASLNNDKNLNIKYNQNAISLCQDIKEKRFANRCYLILAEDALKKEKYHKSLDYLKKLTAQKNIELHLSAVPEITLLKAKNYQKLGRDKESLMAFKDHFAVKDSLDNLINNELVYSIESEYITAKQDNILKELKNKDELQDLKLTQQYGFGLSIIAFFILISGSFVFLARQNNKIKIQTEILSSAVNEKNILLKEIHHRVKNNLQVISSLFKLHSRHITDESALTALQEGRNRVNSMAILHQNLYQEDNLKGIEMKGYIDQLCDAIFLTSSSRNDKISYNNSIQSITLDIDTVIPLGLILTEFITRSTNQNFANVDNPSINVILTENNNELQLSVIDNGQQPLSSHVTENSFSEKIITAFSKKLKATYSYKSGDQNVSTLNIQRYKKASL